MRLSLTIFLVIIFLRVSAQETTADFLLPANGCLNETIKLKNLSSNAIKYEWDFCQGDLEQTPAPQNVGSLAGSGSQGVKVVYDGQNWFAFIVTKDENNLIRLDYGASLDATPVKNNLGDLNGGIVSPNDIEIVYSSGNWYGFVYGVGTATVTRIDFGTSLTTSAPSLTTTTIISGTAEGSFSGLDVVYDDGAWYVVYTRPSSVSVARLASITSLPGPGDLITTGNVPELSFLGDIKTVQDDGQWYAYGVTVGTSRLYRFPFGTDIFSVPTVENITGTWMGTATPLGLDIGLDKGEFYCVISTNQGLVKVNLGSDLNSSPSGTFLGSLGVLPQLNKIDLIKHNGFWRAFSCATFSNNIYRVTFPHQDCGNPNTSSDEPVITYSSEGTKGVSLRAYRDEFNYEEAGKVVTIGSTDAPLIDFTTDGVCLQGPVNFSPVSTFSITDYLWSFGDSQTSTDQDASHQYAATGDYEVSLLVTSDNGCSNYKEKILSIFDEPNPDFILPATNPLCSNQNHLFENSSTIDPDYPVNWQWYVNGVLHGLAENFSFAFPQTTNQDVMLVGSIPGCENSVTKSITTLVEGPVTEFSFVGQCEGEAVTFTNGSSGTIDGYSWDFDDGQSSSNTNPTHVFSATGVYDVTLTASNTVTGCNNTKTKSVPVYSKPQVNFLLSPPPFSCSGTPSQFNDLTPNPPDSNIDSWAWNFGDAGSSQNTSTLKNPLHTYANAGNYDVSLTVTTNFLCSSTLQTQVTISQTPTANFTNAPTCEDVPVNFAGSSTATITSWNWTIGSSAYTSQNPTHIFNNPGNTSATLNATATNGCIGTITKAVVIPAKLTPDFSVARNCVNQQTTFTDITNATADPLSSQQWNFGGLETANGSPVNFTFVSTGNINVVLTSTTQTGCVYTLSKVVNIITSPQASFTPTPGVGAPPLAVQFTNTSVNATSYQWAFRDQNNTMSNAVSPTFVYQNLGEYQPELTAFNAQNCFHTTSRTVSVVVPVVNVALDGLELMEFQNGLKPAVNIFNHGNTPLTNIALLLDFSGQVIRERVSATINPGTSYRYVFSFEFPTATSVDYFCVDAEVADITPIDNEVCLSVEQTFITFSPYPNPSKGSFHLDWIAKEAGTVNLTVINAMGQEQNDLQIESVEGLNPVTIETSGLSAGIYFVKVKYQQITKVYRVLVSE